MNQDNSGGMIPGHGSGSGANAPPRSRVVEAGRGASWVGEGFRLFMKNPLVWVILAVLLGLIMVIVGMVPLLGPIGLNLLVPVFTGGLMLGCRTLQSGGELEIGHLFAGFKQRTTELLILGLLYMAGAIVIFIVIGVIAGGGVLSGLLLGHSTGAGLAASSILLAALLAFALAVPLTMANWFAAPLVLLRNVAPLDALKSSFFACLKNFAPFLVFGIITMVLGIVATIPFGLGLLIVGPAMIGALYASYVDVYPE